MEAEGSEVGGSWCVVGGAGFIGSHLVERLLGEGRAQRVVVLDNLSSGSREQLGASLHDERVSLVVGDCGDPSVTVPALAGIDVVVHLASNPDIARAVTEPEIDFDSGTRLSNTVVEASRRNGVGTVVYASGSGVYGDLGDFEIPEDHGPLRPVSTYGASKLAGEALVCSYAHMFGLRGRAFRFANVVGPRQTHGVGYDFLAKLGRSPGRLRRSSPISVARAAAPRSAATSWSTRSVPAAWAWSTAPSTRSSTARSRSSCSCPGRAGDRAPRAG